MQLNIILFFFFNAYLDGKRKTCVYFDWLYNDELALSELSILTTCTERDADRSAEERAATMVPLEKTRLMMKIATPRMRRSQKSLEVCF